VKLEARAYRRSLDVIIANLSDQAYHHGIDDVFSIRVDQDYFTVFNATCSQIGALGPLAAKVVQLYAAGKGLLEDVAELRDVRERFVTNGTPIDRRWLLQTTQATRQFMEWIVVHGGQVAGQLAAHAKPRWGLF
jgi:hypothetical protein